MFFKEQPRVHQPLAPWREARGRTHKKNNSTISKKLSVRRHLNPGSNHNKLRHRRVCSTQMCAMKNIKNLSPVLMKQLSSSAFCVFFVFLLTHIFTRCECQRQNEIFAFSWEDNDMRSKNLEIFKKIQKIFKKFKKVQKFQKPSKFSKNSKNLQKSSKNCSKFLFFWKIFKNSHNKKNLCNFTKSARAGSLSETTKR